MEYLKKKLEEIIDFDIREAEKTWNEKDVKIFEEKHHLKLRQDYAFYLQYYGNDYIKENYSFISSMELPKEIRQTQFEIDSIFGLNNDENNIDYKINFYGDALPTDLFPIADLPGGNLICMGRRGEKQYKIYIWLHEMDEENAHLVSTSFENFINSFQKIDVKENNLDHIELHLGTKLDAFLKNASKK